MANRNKSRLLFSSAEMFKKPLRQTVWTQIRLLVCSGSTLFASILNLSVMLGNYLQQMTSADEIFRCIFFLGTLRVKQKVMSRSYQLNQSISILRDAGHYFSLSSNSNRTF